MKQVNVHYAKTHLSRLLDEVARGEEIIIAKAGKPYARLVVEAPPTHVKSAYEIAEALNAKADPKLIEAMLWETDAVTLAYMTGEMDDDTDRPSLP